MLVKGTRRNVYLSINRKDYAIETTKDYKELPQECLYRFYTLAQMTKLAPYKNQILFLCLIQCIRLYARVKTSKTFLRNH